MSDLKAKMHQIRFPLGLRPRPRWRSLQRSTDRLAVFKGSTSMEREGKGRREKGKTVTQLNGTNTPLFFSCNFGVSINFFIR